MEKQIRNIGIFAHVDAGKTTLTERLLLHAGAIRQAGQVDAGTAHTDRLSVERRRGISVRATCAPLTWKGTRIQLIDTPGHQDFAAEVERSLLAIDGAVLLLSAVEGIQPRTEALFDAFRRHGFPVLLFINKADREGADPARVIEEAKAALSPRVADYQSAEALQCLLAEEDEALLADYLEGRLHPREALLPRVHEMARRGEGYPVLMGSALKDMGVDALLDAMIQCLPPPQGKADGPACGVVFALEQDRALGRSAYVRLYSGTLRNRETVTLHTPKGPVETKVTQVRSIPLEGAGEDLGVLTAGETGQVFGLADARVGQVIGDAAHLPRRVTPGEMGAPLLMAKVSPENPEDRHALKAALETLSAEDPLLSVTLLQDMPHVRLMGAIQLEVLAETLSERFGIAARFDPPTVIYRETVAQPAVGFFAYTMPKPCWAVIKFQIEPLPRGSGIQYESAVPVREIMARYQHQIEQALPRALRQGMLGWQVDDVKITLIGGEHHLVHTHPLDFILATPVALMDGLRRAGSVLLEPILELRMTVPESTAGKLVGEIALMRGEILSSEMRGDMLRIVAQAPMSASVDFSVRIAALTGGRGALAVRLCGYRQCDMALGATCPRQGVHPLDTAKYILAARSAMGGGVFEG